MNNKKISLFLLLAFFSLLHLNAQNKTMLVFDLANGTLDSISNISIDTSIQFDNTPFYIGDFNSNVQLLEQDAPVENVYPNTQFTYKKKAALDFELNSYPIRTSVKIFYIENGVLNNLCSGSFISKKHILTAAHCLSEINTNTLLLDSIVVCPVYDNGNTNPNFTCTNASKVYFFKDWVVAGEDFAILELEEPLGMLTGWISIGFDETNNQFTDDIFYKFTYPSIFIPPIDSTEYNGDTLYYNYGKIDIIDDYFIGVSNTSGIVGESGSSLIRVLNNEQYISHGVLTYSNNLRHSKITREIFYFLQHVIEDDIVLNTNDLDTEAELRVFPNPTNGIFQIENLSENEPANIYIYDLLGRTVYFKNHFVAGQQINISSLASGQYFIMIQTGQAEKAVRIIKY